MSISNIDLFRCFFKNIYTIIVPFFVHMNFDIKHINQDNSGSVKKITFTPKSNILISAIIKSYAATIEFDDQYAIDKVSELDLSYAIKSDKDENGFLYNITLSGLIPKSDINTISLIEKLRTGKYVAVVEDLNGKVHVFGYYNPLCKINFDEQSGDKPEALNRITFTIIYTEKKRIYSNSTPYSDPILMDMLMSNFDGISVSYKNLTLTQDIPQMRPVLESNYIKFVP